MFFRRWIEKKAAQQTLKVAEAEARLEEWRACEAKAAETRALLDAEVIDAAERLREAKAGWVATEGQLASRLVGAVLRGAEPVSEPASIDWADLAEEMADAMALGARLRGQPREVVIAEAARHAAERVWGEVGR